MTLYSIKLFLNDLSTKLLFLIPLVYINQSYLAFVQLNYLRLSVPMYIMKYSLNFHYSGLNLC